MKIKVWKTDREGNRLALTNEGEMQYINTDVIDRYDHTGDVEANVVNIHDDVEYQTVGGSDELLKKLEQNFQQDNAVAFLTPLQIKI